MTVALTPFQRAYRGLQSTINGIRDDDRRLMLTLKLGDLALAHQAEVINLKGQQTIVVDGIPMTHEAIVNATNAQLVQGYSQ